MIFIICFITQGLNKVNYLGILPHGDFVYDPSLIHNKNKSLEIHQAALKLQKNLIELAPDIIYLSSPHGLQIQKDFLFILNTFQQGFADIGQDINHTQYKIKKRIETSAHASQLLYFLENKKHQVTGLKAFSDMYASTLGWGEVIPLSFTPELSKYILMIQPLRRFDQSLEMIPEMILLGESIFEYLDHLNENVAVIISADLAHTHSEDGPYGYSEEAQKFDDAITFWAQTQQKIFLLEAAEYQNKALSCGFTGISLLQGMLQQGKFMLKGLEVGHPTYYGMMVAEFFRKDTFQNQI